MVSARASRAVQRSVGPSPAKPYSAATVRTTSAARTEPASPLVMTATPEAYRDNPKSWRGIPGWRRCGRSRSAPLAEDVDAQPVFAGLTAQHLLRDCLRHHLLRSSRRNHLQPDREPGQVFGVWSTGRPRPVRDRCATPPRPACRSCGIAVARLPQLAGSGWAYVLSSMPSGCSTGRPHALSEVASSRSSTTYWAIRCRRRNNASCPAGDIHPGGFEGAACPVQQLNQGRHRFTARIAGEAVDRGSARATAAGAASPVTPRCARWPVPSTIQ